ncbi:MAG: diacylglycerol kinase family lipid kinase [Gammaproteobacteria bacterium]|nr:diacylglycerol kinase family lipid kinase [Gammaproteobacteria bacterium]
MAINKPKKLYFLLNPTAGNGNAYDIFKQAKRILDKEQIGIESYLSQSKGDIEKFIINEDLSEFDGICVIGGDGTIHEAIEGLMQSKKSKYLSLGIIPGGSGNAFAEDLGLRDPLDALENIIIGNISRIDVMRIKTRENINFAVNIIGWGMASNVNILAEKLRWLGSTRYSIASIISIITIKLQSLNIIIENKVFDGKAAFFIALNTIHTGKGMKMAPQAKLNDGLIDIILLKRASRLRVLKIFLQLFSGKHIYDPLVQYMQVKSFSINSKNDCLNIDGENIGKTPIEVSVERNAIQLFAKI